ncbi:MAG: SUMF1/EgtB/PvdO family nonheme iron enzyme, partial [Verrucomicrobiota bacterium]
MGKVFISYSHDSEAHRGRVSALANRLKADGIEVTIDIDTADPAIGWPRWSAANAEHAEKVLMVVTETYKKRFYDEGEEDPGKGRGAAHEASVLYQRLYNTKNNPFCRIVVLEDQDRKFVPIELQRYHTYHAENEYSGLVDWIEGRAVSTEPSRPVGGSQGSKLVALLSIAGILGIAAVGWMFKDRISAALGLGVLVEQNLEEQGQKLVEDKVEEDKTEEGHIEEPVTVENATKESPYINDLGMTFVPVPGTNVLFSIWETRVQDFRQFAADPSYSYEEGEIPFLLTKTGWKADDNVSWESPGFQQQEDHPVTCVSVADAIAFCNWLTREDSKGLQYRLPKDAEWSNAVGQSQFLWGDGGVPPNDSGNYAGKEAMGAG